VRLIQEEFFARRESLIRAKVDGRAIAKKMLLSAKSKSEDRIPAYIYIGKLNWQLFGKWDDRINNNGIPFALYYQMSFLLTTQAVNFLISS
jgi:hypothetical protein